MNLLEQLKITEDKFYELEFKEKRETSLEVQSVLSEICSQLFQCEKVGYSKADMLNHLNKLREYVGKSPFWKRLQTWPRGYLGDFETIEYLCTAQNQCKPNTIEYILESFAFTTSICQQHRNKIIFQTQNILDVVAHKPNAHILSLAAGSCLDIRAITNIISQTSASFVINDQDSNALVFSKEKLSSINDHCAYLHADVLKAVKSLRGKAKFDLVLAGGLFDYLTDSQIKFILKYVFNDLLLDGGKIIFTNIAQGNPYRVYMDYLVSWEVIERTENDINSMIEQAIGMSNCVYKIERDLTTLAHLVRVLKRNSEGLFKNYDDPNKSLISVQVANPAPLKSQFLCL